MIILCCSKKLIMAIMNNCYDVLNDDDYNSTIEFKDIMFGHNMQIDEFVGPGYCKISNKYKFDCVLVYIS